MIKYLAPLLAFGLTACTTTTATPTADEPAQSAEPSGLQTSTIPDTDGVLQRFTKDIWPAMEEYRFPGQGGPQYARYLQIVDKDLPAERWNALHAADESLGVVWHDRQKRETFNFPVGDLHLADVSLTSLHPPAATLVICFTFDALRSEMTGQTREAAASEATIELRKTDTWYLHAITDDHRVPGCGAPKD